MDDDLARIFEAHVRYEVDRWASDAAVGDTVAEEVGGVFDLLDVTTLRAAVPVERARGWAGHVVVHAPLTESLFEEVEWVAHAAHESLLEETGPLSDVLPQERFEALVTAAVDLRELRREVVDQLTGSAVYAELISHVLYHGVKDYLLTENAVVRHVPGASSLLRMGQNAVRSATPNLEAGIDRRLLAFVASNVTDTVRDSHRFLESTLDDATLRTIADEIWAVNGSRTVGDLAAAVEAEPLGDLVATALRAWPAARSHPLVTRLVDAVVEQFYRAHGDEPVSVLLTDLGITRELATSAATAVAASWVAAARDGGQLEEYVRRRLGGFYSGYSA